MRLSCVTLRMRLLYDQWRMRLFNTTYTLHPPRLACDAYIYPHILIIYKKESKKKGLRMRIAFPAFSPPSSHPHSHEALDNRVHMAYKKDS